MLSPRRHIGCLNIAQIDIEIVIAAIKYAWRRHDISRHTDVDAISRAYLPAE